MSPEQAAGRPVDPRADVYALGAILYYVLAGTPQPSSARPTTAASPPFEPRLPPDLLAIVDKALAADAARRYPSAFELADDLKRFAGGQLVAARRYSPLVRAGPVRRPPPGRRRPSRPRPPACDRGARAALTAPRRGPAPPPPAPVERRAPARDEPAPLGLLRQGASCSLPREQLGRPRP